MAKYQISAPDGSSYEITAPDDATEAQVLAYAQGQWKQPDTQAQPGLLDQVYSDYPRLKQYDFQLKNTPQQPGDSRHMEFYFPGTEENPFGDKSKPGIEVFDPKMGKQDILGEMLHYLPKADPAMGRLKQRFMQSISPDQRKQWLEGDYQAQLKHGLLGENPSFEKWLNNQGGDAFFRGYLAKQYPDEAYTPAQKALFGEVESYLRSPAVPRGTSTAYDPTSSMSGTEKFRAGYGKSAADLYRGSKQSIAELMNMAQNNPAMGAIPGVGGALDVMGLLGRAGGVDDNTVTRLRQEQDEAKRLDKPLMETGAGLGGAITGAVANTLPTAFVPGANTYAGAGAIGGLLAALQPVGVDESRAVNAGVGGLLGVGTNALFRAVPALWNAGKSYLAPLTKKGQERIAAETVERFAGNPASIDQAASYASGVPGVKPTLAEATMDPGIATLQLATKNVNPAAKAQLLDQEIANTAARVGAIGNIAGDDATRAAAVKARDQVAEKLYGQAFNLDAMRREMATESLRQQASNATGGIGTPALLEQAEGQLKQQLSPRLQSLVDRPAFQSAMKTAQRLAADKGVDIGDPLTSLRGNHYLKLALDDMLAPSATNALGRNERAALMDMKSILVDEMTKPGSGAPLVELPKMLYGGAKDAYQEMSAPINQMDVGQALYNKLIPELSASAPLPTRTTANSFATALRNAEQTAKQATGMSNMTLEKIMTPEQMATINAVKMDLARKAAADDLAKTLGSTTGQNLAAQSMMRRTLGPLGVPQGWMEGEALPSVFKALMSPYKLINADDSINQQLVSLLMDPKKAAAAIKNLPKPVQNSLLTRAANPVTAGLLRANASEQ